MLGTKNGAAQKKNTQKRQFLRQKKCMYPGENVFFFLKSQTRAKKPNNLDQILKMNHQKKRAIGQELVVHL